MVSSSPHWTAAQEAVRPASGAPGRRFRRPGGGPVGWVRTGIRTAQVAPSPGYSTSGEFSESVHKAAGYKNASEAGSPRGVRTTVF